MQVNIYLSFKQNQWSKMTLYTVNNLWSFGCRIQWSTTQCLILYKAVIKYTRQCLSLYKAVMDFQRQYTCLQYSVCLSLQGIIQLYKAVFKTMKQCSILQGSVKVYKALFISSRQCWSLQGFVHSTFWNIARMSYRATDSWHPATSPTITTTLIYRVHYPGKGHNFTCSYFKVDHISTIGQNPVTYKLGKEQQLQGRLVVLF